MFPADLRPQIARASQLLAQGRLTDAEREAAAALAAFGRGCGEALLLLGLIRSAQQRSADAAGLLAEAVAILPPTPEAWYALGGQQARLGRFADAEQSFRRVLELAPQHGETRMGLAACLLELGRADEAERVLRQALQSRHHPMVTAGLAQNLALAQGRQSKHGDALASLELAERSNPRQKLHGLRSEILVGLQRFDEALAALRAQLDMTPSDAALHKQYNDLLYMLGRDQEAEFLASYDRAPKSEALQVAKAGFLLLTRRDAQAHEIFSGILAANPAHEGAAMGAANALDRMRRHDEAEILLERALTQHPDSATLLNALAATALFRKDPEKAAAMAQRAVAISPFYQYALANLGTAWRLMGDDRDELLNGYDLYVRVFDLEPPQGFPDMASFNAALLAELDGLHPPTREFLDQSLRCGTQTRGSLFNARHPLVQRLKARIDQAVGRYIAELQGGASHPMLARRGRDFAYSGSWSSRLRDCGFHVNHIHPEGWISSCYYAGVPEVVLDQDAKQGWLKVGEPGFDHGLGWRRAVQPAAGRLVLFPSYMWHGTIAFRAPSPRTTIAFDVVPR
jgi:tetratricopeptide (TPR) repeat protein